MCEMIFFFSLYASLTMQKQFPLMNATWSLLFQKNSFNCKFSSLLSRLVSHTYFSDVIRQCFMLFYEWTLKIVIPKYELFANLNVQIYQQLQWLASSFASCRNSVVCGKLETMLASTLNATLETHRFTYS